MFITMLNPHKKSCSTVTVITLPEMKTRLRKLRLHPITQVISSESTTFIQLRRSLFIFKLQSPLENYAALTLDSVFNYSSLSLPVYFYCNVYLSLLCSSFPVPLKYFMPIKKSRLLIRDIQPLGFFSPLIYL